VSLPNLSILLPSAVLDDLVPSFEGIFGLKDSVLIVEADGRHHYGPSNQDRSRDLWATIWVDNESAGQVCLYADQNDPMFRRAIEHLGLMLSYNATDTWRRHQLADEVLERYDELNLIYGLGTNFVQGMAQNEIVQNVLVETNSILQADSGAIYVWDSDKSTLVPISFFGDKASPDFWDGRVRELALSTLYAYEQAQLFDSDKIICAPLRYNDELLGSLVLQYEREDKSFKANDVNLVTTLMQNTALFIYAARLIDRLARRTVELETTLNELQATKDKLSRAERLSIIGQTVGTLVHDMRKPLSNVMGYAGLLQETDLTHDERYQFAEQIIKYVEAFSSMAQEILDYIAGDQTIQKKHVRVEDYMAQVADMLMPPGLERPVKITLNADAARGYVMNIDTQRFMRVFQNLVNNAVDAIESKGGTHVEISVEPIDNLIRFTVTDDGPGVPPQIASTLFDPFVTLGKSHGTGLGLAIVDRMIEMHGGKIRYEGIPGGGARFVFTVPQAANGSKS
jgi:signal transduction histidine kinase